MEELVVIVRKVLHLLVCGMKIMVELRIQQPVRPMTETKPRYLVIIIALALSVY